MKKFLPTEPEEWAELRKALCDLIEEIKKQPNDSKRAKAKADAIIKKGEKRHV